MPMKIDGLDDLLGKLSKSMLADAKQEVAGELYRFGEEIMADSKEVVPVDTGAMMNTGKVALPTENGDLIEVTLGYGDESVGYALYVHEELQAPSGGPIKYTRPGSGPKFLSNPAISKAPELPGRVKDALMRAITG
jgi:hypothetical protein